MIARRQFHRLVFCVAGTYNIAWGLYAVWDPQWLFRFAGLPPLNHPQIFACLGMVVGLYGILYFEVARVPERGWLLAAVGLMGKILGPIGLAGLILSGAWPKSTIVFCLPEERLVGVDSVRVLSPGRGPGFCEGVSVRRRAPARK